MNIIVITKVQLERDFVSLFAEREREREIGNRGTGNGCATVDVVCFLARCLLIVLISTGAEGGCLRMPTATNALTLAFA